MGNEMCSNFREGDMNENSCVYTVYVYTENSSSGKWWKLCVSHLSVVGHDFRMDWRKNLCVFAYLSTHKSMEVDRRSGNLYCVRLAFNHHYSPCEMNKQAGISRSWKVFLLECSSVVCVSFFCFNAKFSSLSVAFTLKFTCTMGLYICKKDSFSDSRNLVSSI